ncbi:concanavalin A-like lectin/glucanase superfamily protein [Stackebrandtia albiflava]|uniref:Concanavalin A-like lectin/glucanase superfamily protein n=2 Tax=Stackebrandtia albiflava TaxID=406432 RepID=A0A562V3T8_9ACTN|nr:concanavalin A-like lectin/glucanase superfamily protein [Stackebrandtia albiflava]
MSSVDGAEQVAAAATAPVVGEWYHLAVVYDAPQNTLRLYVGGSAAATVTGPQQPWHADGRLLVGVTGADAQNRTYGPGGVDDVFVYHGAFGQEQITDLASGVLPHPR